MSRLGTVYPSAQAAIALIKQIGIVPEWDEYWDRYFTYELRDVDGGVTPASDRGAVLEDLGYGNAMYWSGPDAPIHALWTAIIMPALALRARREILPGFGFILPAAEAEAVRGGGAIGTRGGDRREPLHDHHARRFHRRHRCVPAQQAERPGEVGSALAGPADLSGAVGSVARGHSAAGAELLPSRPGLLVSSGKSTLRPGTL